MSMEHGESIPRNGSVLELLYQKMVLLQSLLQARLEGKTAYESKHDWPFGDDN
jgi:hypothetical protein